MPTQGDAAVYRRRVQLMHKGVEFVAGTGRKIDVPRAQRGQLASHRLEQATERAVAEARGRIVVRRDGLGAERDDCETDRVV